MRYILIAIFTLSLGVAQDIKSILSDDADAFSSNAKESIQQLDITDMQSLTYTPVEKSIDPDKYILGPGDLLGISIVSTTNISLPIRINPVGELIIPSVGVVNVDGKSLSPSFKNKLCESFQEHAVAGIDLYPPVQQPAFSFGAFVSGPF